jgi:hypothetical protein
VPHTRVRATGVEVTVQLSGARLWLMAAIKDESNAASPRTSENQP